MAVDGWCFAWLGVLDLDIYCGLSHPVRSLALKSSYGVHVCVSVHEERKSMAWVVEYNGPAGRGNGREGRDDGRGDGRRGMGIGGDWLLDVEQLEKEAHVIAWCGWLSCEKCVVRV